MSSEERSTQQLVIEIEQASAKLRRASRALVLLWLAAGFVLAPVGYALLRYDLVIGRRSTTEMLGLLAYGVVTAAILFLLGVMVTARLARTTSRQQLIWHVVIWVALLIAATPLIVHHLSQLGWTGAYWLFWFGGVVILAGIPFGCLRAADWLTKFQTMRDAQASQIAMRAHFERERAGDAMCRAWNREADLTFAAIQTLSGRNHVTDQYAAAANTAMSRILAPSPSNGTLLQRTAAMRSLRMQIESGAPMT